MGLAQTHPIELLQPNVDSDFSLSTSVDWLEGLYVPSETLLLHGKYGHGFQVNELLVEGK